MVYKHIRLSFTVTLAFLFCFTGCLSVLHSLGVQTGLQLLESSAFSIIGTLDNVEKLLEVLVTDADDALCLALVSANGSRRE